MPDPIHLTPPLFAVRAVPGHEEDEALLKRSDLPSMGRVVNLWREGTKLIADFDDVPEVVEDLIKQKTYSKISAEFYEGFEAGGKPYGAVLRRVALLGAEIPEVKTLADIPTPANGKLRGVEIFDAGVHKGKPYPIEFLDEAVRNFHTLSKDAGPEAAATFAEAKHTTVRFFSEPRRRTMPLPKSWLPKNWKAPVAKFSDRPSFVIKKFADEPAETPMEAPPPAEVNRADLIATLTELGFDTAVLTDAVPDNVLAEMIRVYQGMKAAAAPPPQAAMSDPASAPAPAPSPAPASVPGVPTGQTPSQVTLKFQEIEQNIQRLQKFTEDRLVAEKKARIKAELDTLVQQGKVIPAERPALDEVLYLADAATVHKFSEGGKEIEQTALDRMLATLKARPPIARFAETVAQPLSPGQGMDAARKQQLMKATPLGAAALASQKKAS